MNADAGVMLLFNLPPYSYCFGIHPLHWSIGEMRSETKCSICKGIARAIMVRFGPLTFVVTHQTHDHSH